MSLYISRLLLNPRSRQVMSELTQPYEMHRTLMRAFPPANDTHTGAREEYGVLFRVEADESQAGVKVYVQSIVEPNWSFLDGLDGYLDAEAVTPRYEHKDILPACRRIRAGQILSFRLRANPTKRIANAGDAMKGKRVELQREEDQLAWLIRKGRATVTGGPGGFELLMRRAGNSGGEPRPIPRVNVCREGKLEGQKREARSGHKTTHLAVLFEGLLRVTNTEAFIETLVRGIGSGKAFGFGLLSVAPFRVPGEEEAT